MLGALQGLLGVVGGPYGQGVMGALGSWLSHQEWKKAKAASEANLEEAKGIYDTSGNYMRSKYAAIADEARMDLGALSGDLLSGQEELGTDLMGGYQDRYDDLMASWDTGSSDLMGGYGDAMTDVMGGYDDRETIIGGGYDARTTSILGQLDPLIADVNEGLADRHSRGMEYLEGAGVQGRADIGQRFDEAGTEARQRLVSSGLANSSTMPSIHGGIERERGAELRRFDEGIRREWLETDASLSGDALSAQYGMGAGRASMAAGLTGEALSAQTDMSGQRLAAMESMLGRQLSAEERMMMGRMEYDTALSGEMLTTQERMGQQGQALRAAVGAQEIQQNRELGMGRVGLEGDLSSRDVGLLSSVDYGYPDSHWLTNTAQQLGANSVGSSGGGGSSSSSWIPAAGATVASIFMPYLSPVFMGAAGAYNAYEAGGNPYVGAGAGIASGLVGGFGGGGDNWLGGFNWPGQSGFSGGGGAPMPMSSDRNLKENFQEIDPQQVLERLEQLPITQWNWKDRPGVPHLGPVAQDFAETFGLGDDDRRIEVLDALGVSLAAIQALATRVAQLENEVAERQLLVSA